MKPPICSGEISDFQFVTGTEMFLRPSRHFCKICLVTGLGHTGCCEGVGSETRRVSSFSQLQPSVAFRAKPKFFKDLKLKQSARLTRRIECRPVVVRREASSNGRVSSSDSCLDYDGSTLETTERIILQWDSEASEESRGKMILQRDRHEVVRFLRVVDEIQRFR